jgi:hypothetical protein
MKKFLWACVLALPLAAVSQSTASAGGFEIRWTGHCDFDYSWGINCWHSDKGCSHKSYQECSVPDCSYGDSSSGGYPGNCLDGFNGGGYGGYAGMPVQAMPQAPVNYGSYGFQPVGYVGAPSYWYGR